MKVERVKFQEVWRNEQHNIIAVLCNDGTYAIYLDSDSIGTEDGRKYPALESVALDMKAAVLYEKEKDRAVDH